MTKEGYIEKMKVPSNGHYHSSVERAKKGNIGVSQLDDYNNQNDDNNELEDEEFYDNSHYLKKDENVDLIKNNHDRNGLVLPDIS
jgi:hypothetical protein